MPGDDPVLGVTSFNKVHVPGNTLEMMEHFNANRPRIGW
jgi:hypothetical protein